jgi:hypothetical protein
MSTRPVKTFAAEAARTFGRRLRAARRDGASARSRRARGHSGPAPATPVSAAVPLPQAPRLDEIAPVADEAELDALRGALVRELDRLAADDDCSASFRRA